MENTYKVYCLEFEGEKMEFNIIFKNDSIKFVCGEVITKVFSYVDFNDCFQDFLIEQRKEFVRTVLRERYKRKLAIDFAKNVFNRLGAYDLEEKLLEGGE